MESLDKTYTTFGIIPKEQHNTARQHDTTRHHLLVKFEPSKAFPSPSQNSRSLSIPIYHVPIPIPTQYNTIQYNTT